MKIHHNDCVKFKSVITVFIIKSSLGIIEALYSYNGNIGRLYIYWLFAVVTLMALVGDFAGFFVQARTESNSDSLSSIVGTWAPVTAEAASVPCDNRADVSSY